MKSGKVVKVFVSRNGHTVTLRYPTIKDLDGALTYANNLIKEDTYVEIYGKPLTRAEEKKWLEDALKRIKKGEMIQLVVEIGGHYVGSASLTRGVRRKSHVAAAAIGLAREYREEGIGTILFHSLLDEGSKLGLRLIELSCFENNPRALHVYEKIGFKTIGVIPGAIHFKDAYVGEVKMYLPLDESPAH